MDFIQKCLVYNQLRWVENVLLDNETTVTLADGTVASAKDLCLRILQQHHESPEDVYLWLSKRLMPDEYIHVDAPQQKMNRLQLLLYQLDWYGWNRRDALSDKKECITLLEEWVKDSNDEKIVVISIFGKAYTRPELFKMIADIKLAAHINSHMVYLTYEERVAFANSNFHV